jgi:hypothetical protein
MRLSTYVPVTLAVLLGGAACFGVAVASVSAVETQSRREVAMALRGGRSRLGGGPRRRAPGHPVRHRAGRSRALRRDQRGGQRRGRQPRDRPHRRSRRATTPRRRPSRSTSCATTAASRSSASCRRARTGTRSSGAREASAPPTVTDLPRTRGLSGPGELARALSSGSTRSRTCPGRRSPSNPNRVTVTAIAESAAAKRAGRTGSAPRPRRAWTSSSPSRRRGRCCALHAPLRQGRPRRPVRRLLGRQPRLARDDPRRRARGGPPRRGELPRGPRPALAALGRGRGPRDRRGGLNSVADRSPSRTPTCCFRRHPAPGRPTSTGSPDGSTRRCPTPSPCGRSSRNPRRRRRRRTKRTTSP